MRAAILAFISLMVMAFVDPGSDRLPDPKQEARAEALFSQIRCVVCQNESIAASEAELAHDMRMLVREQVAQGKTNSQIKDYLFNRYGDFILLRPRFTPATAVLWLAPFAVVFLGIGALLLRRRKVAPLEDGLTDDELKALKKLDIKQAP